VIPGFVCSEFTFLTGQMLSSCSLSEADGMWV
jgi:hypothetical protein